MYTCPYVGALLVSVVEGQWEEGWERDGRWVQETPELAVELFQGLAS